MATITMKYKAGGAGALRMQAVSAAASPVPVRRIPHGPPPVKPMATSTSLHSLHPKSALPAENPPLGKLARRDRVVLEHLPLVKAIAVRVHENLPVHVDLDDLVHAGILGLFDAASKYNPDKQVVFSSYAK
ncbi:MAG: sigma factor, partial [Terriglobia bacterium]